MDFFWSRSPACSVRSARSRPACSRKSPRRPVASNRRRSSGLGINPCDASTSRSRSSIRGNLASRNISRYRSNAASSTFVNTSTARFV